MTNCGASFKGCISEIAPIPKAQGALKKGGCESYKSHEISKFAVRPCLLIIAEATPTKSHEHGCLNMD